MVWYRKPCSRIHSNPSSPGQLPRRTNLDEVTPENMAVVHEPADRLRVRNQVTMPGVTGIVVSVEVNDPHVLLPVHVGEARHVRKTRWNGRHQ